MFWEIDFKLVQQPRLQQSDATEMKLQLQLRVGQVFFCLTLMNFSRRYEQNPGVKKQVKHQRCAV